MATDDAGRTQGLTRRGFLGATALGVAGGTGLATLGGCGDGAARASTDGRTFSLPAREEWKRREVHRSGVRGWSDIRYSPGAASVPASIALFGEEYGATDFAAALADVAVGMDVVYAFWDGSFVKQRETVAPLRTLAEAVGAGLPPSSAAPFVTTRSSTRAEIMSGAPAGLRDGIVEPTYSYRVTFPRDTALDSGVVVFDPSDPLRYYALAVEGYGARAFVKYFSRLDLGSEYVGPDGSTIDDYVVDNIPADRFFDLRAGTVNPALPAWA